MHVHLLLISLGYLKKQGRMWLWRNMKSKSWGQDWEEKKSWKREIATKSFYIIAKKHRSVMKSLGRKAQFKGLLKFILISKNVHLPLHTVSIYIQYM